MGVPHPASLLHEGALGNTAGQRWGSREPPMFRAFSVSWIRGSAPRKPFLSVSCKGIPAKGQHWLPQNCPNWGRPHSTPGRQLSYLRCPGCQLCPAPQACQAGKAPLWWEPGAPRGSESAQGLARPSLRPTGQPQRGLGLRERAEAISWECHTPQWPAFPVLSPPPPRLSQRGPPVTSCPKPRETFRGGRGKRDIIKNTPSSQELLLQGPRLAHPALCEVWGTQCEGDRPQPYPQGAGSPLRRVRECAHTWVTDM